MGRFKLEELVSNKPEHQAKQYVINIKSLSDHFKSHCGTGEDRKASIYIPSLNQSIDNITAVPESLAILWNRKQKDYKSQRNRMAPL